MTVFGYGMKCELDADFLRLIIRESIFWHKDFSFLCLCYLFSAVIGQIFCAFIMNVCFAELEFVLSLSLLIRTWS